MMAATYREPYQFSAGVLALLVHGVFFSVLYFGFSWQTQPVMESMNVELWDGLPAAAAPLEIAAPPAPPEVIAPPPEPDIKPDIVVPDKNKPAHQPVRQPDTKPTREVKKPAEKPSLLARYGIEGGTGNGAQTGSRQPQQARREVAARLSETERIVNEYGNKIQAKIKRNIVMPPDVAFNARVKFSVTLLPDGSVMTAKLKESSGNAAYDSAVERAMLKAQPLPIPSEPELFGHFRELNLCFSPFKEALCH
jgi:colicin import membrane protein